MGPQLLMASCVLGQVGESSQKAHANYGLDIYEQGDSCLLRPTSHHAPSQGRGGTRGGGD